MGHKDGITVGSGNGTTFSPSVNCTRAQFVTFLWRAAEKPEPTSTVNKFSDVSETAHADYYKAILWDAENGITSGTGNGTFSPDKPVTRAETVTFMHRYAQKANIAAKAGVETFDDVNNEGNLIHYYDAIGWTQANGISNGIGANNFGPLDTCSRGEMVTFLYRLFTDATA